MKTVHTDIVLTINLRHIVHPQLKGSSVCFYPLSVNGGMMPALWHATVYMLLCQIFIRSSFISRRQKWYHPSDKFSSFNSQMEYDLPSSIFITPPPPCDNPGCWSASSACAADYDKRNVTATERRSRVYLFCSCLRRMLNKTKILRLCCAWVCAP